MAAEEKSSAALRIATGDADHLRRQRFTERLADDGLRRMSLNIDDLTVNLSYVLHEPSMSSIVHDFAKRVGTHERAVRRLTERLSRLSDAALAERIIRQPIAAGAASDNDSEVRDVLTIHLGVWPLIQRVVDLAGFVVENARPVRVHFIDDSRSSGDGHLSLFRSPARVGLPIIDPQVITAWFAAAIVRPDGETVLLVMEPIRGSADDRLGQVVEATIRSHMQQWFCPVRLWDQPIERALPEFGAR